MSVLKSVFFGIKPNPVYNLKVDFSVTILNFAY